MAQDSYYIIDKKDNMSALVNFLVRDDIARRYINEQVGSRTIKRNQEDNHIIKIDGQNNAFLVTYKNDEERVETPLQNSRNLNLLFGCMIAGFVLGVIPGLIMLAVYLDKRASDKALVQAKLNVVSGKSDENKKEPSYESSRLDVSSINSYTVTPKQAATTEIHANTSPPPSTNTSPPPSSSAPPPPPVIAENSATKPKNKNKSKEPAANPNKGNLFAQIRQGIKLKKTVDSKVTSTHKPALNIGQLAAAGRRNLKSTTRKSNAPEIGELKITKENGKISAVTCDIGKGENKQIAKFTIKKTKATLEIVDNNNAKVEGISSIVANDLTKKVNSAKNALSLRVVSNINEAINIFSKLKPGLKRKNK